MNGTDSRPDLLCIGHRGAMGHAPENTLASFARALALGAPCIELDVQLVEGRLLVFHDDRLERTSNGHGWFHEASFEQLRALDAGHGERIPTLDEVLALVDRRAGINFELKGADTAAPLARVLERLRRDRWPEALMLVSSFDMAQLHTLRALDAQANLGVLCKQWQPAWLDAARALRASSINLALSAASAENLSAIREAGLRSYVYTVNEPADIAALRDRGADGVFTDFPERVLRGNRAPGIPGWPAPYSPQG